MLPYFNKMNTLLLFEKGETKLFQKCSFSNKIDPLKNKKDRLGDLSVNLFVSNTLLIHQGI